MVTFDFAKTPITSIADHIIIHAAEKHASDIHFDPRDEGVVVRIRIDGDLQDYTIIPKTYERNLVTRLKLMANMNITESRLPQDGSIKGKFGSLDLDMRVSSLPTNEGEKIVVRILDYSRSLEGLESLDFSKENFEKIKRMIAVPNGIILVTGATGTGKSTTTYSIMQALNKKETNIITVEDPIEMNIEGLNQVQVNSDIGLDFATVLRSILRQDPNIILIGEIRDSETAKIAVRASITGHLVLSTIHTNNSLSTIERLLDMSVERYLLASALTGIISQRLAKRLCPKCRKKKETNPYEKKVFKLALDKDINEIYEADPKGCEECTNGYRGRIAVHEVLEIDDHIRNLINNEEVEKDELREKVYSDKTITLLQDGLMKVLDGRTSFDEIFRIIDIDNDIDDSEISVEKEIEEREKAAEENKTNEETPTEEKKKEDAPSEEQPAVEEKQTTLSSPNLATDANELEKKEG
ncbi:MAG: type II/IV secretion system protein [Bacilli bacterium]|nr:type II/IV secretion system protein [Bacilli bacterium]